MSHENKDPKRNASGCLDLTAYQAIKNIEDREKERLHKLLATIFSICELSDFYIEERIVVRDKRTGKVWR